MNKSAWRAFICLWLIGSLIGGAAVAEAGEGLFSRLKAKASQKIEQVQDPVWVKTKLASGAISGIAGKITGFAGLALGAVIGLAVGGPAGAAVGGIIGSRIVSSMTKAYVKPVADEYVNARLTNRSTSIADVWKNLDKKRLAVEGGATAVGSLIGEFAGVAIGAALFAGTGPIAVPIIGIIGCDIIGGKIGKWIGSRLVKKAGVMAYTALAAQPPPATSSAAPSAAKTGAPSASAAATRIDQTRSLYEAAYRSYVAAVQNPNATSAEKDKALREYTAALDAWIAARGSVAGKR